MVGASRAAIFLALPERLQRQAWRRLADEMRTHDREERS